jgi:hypothetical protein
MIQRLGKGGFKRIGGAGVTRPGATCLGHFHKARAGRQIGQRHGIGAGGMPISAIRIPRLRLIHFQHKIPVGNRVANGLDDLWAKCWVFGAEHPGHAQSLAQVDIGSEKFKGNA